MKKLSRLSVFLVLLLSNGALWATNNLPVQAPFPSIVYLQKDCGGLQNCATTLGEMDNWIHTVRIPGAGSPLLVDIGPGNFVEAGAFFECWDVGHITYRGAGRDNTVMGTLYGKNCEGLSVQNLKIVGDGDATTVVGVNWRGTGSSTYSNVDVQINGNGNAFYAYGWWDQTAKNSPCPSVSNRSVHYWYGSKITVTGATGYVVGYSSTCSTENWFYGGELTVTANDYDLQQSTAISLNDASSLQVFGSSVRSLSRASVAAIHFSPRGVLASDDSSFHMHGGIISAVAFGGSDQGAIGVSTSHNATAHVIDTAFNIKPSGSGNATRIMSSSSNAIQSPFQWPQSETPPAITSLVGADTFVETDCDSAGDCSGAGPNLHPHMMIYDASCTGVAGPWFDIVTGACRQ